MRTGTATSGARPPSGRDWAGAYRQLSARAAADGGDETDRASAEDLEALATAAYMVGRDDEHVAALERARHTWSLSGDARRAARCAVWEGINLALRGETARATGSFGIAARLVAGEQAECVERGYLLIPQMFRLQAAGDHDGWRAAAVEAAAIAERCGDPDLLSLAVHEQGRALVAHGRVEAGLGLLDEAMVAASAGRLSPIVTGLLYCSVIDCCRGVFALGRAREWTLALTDWCAAQTGIVAFTGQCLVHRAELLQLEGAWTAALSEARAAQRRMQGDARRAAGRGREGQAHYRQGELHRLRGEEAAAEEAFREASRCGTEPQPGLALLRLAQGAPDAAAAGIARALAEVGDRRARARLLPAQVEIQLSRGDPSAGDAARELREIAEDAPGTILTALAAHAGGAVALEANDPSGALPRLRAAADAWRDLGAPYETARARELIGRACRALGDDDAAGLERDAARATYRELGAAPDLERLEGAGRSPAPAGLTPRELEVLDLLAAGRSNRQIAVALTVSEHTVARHVQNILAKLGVPSRTAAGAFAYEHGLVRGRRGQD